MPPTALFWKLRNICNSVFDWRQPKFEQIWNASTYRSGVVLARMQGSVLLWKEWWKKLLFGFFFALGKSRIKNHFEFCQERNYCAIVKADLLPRFSCISLLLSLSISLTHTHAHTHTHTRSLALTRARFLHQECTPITISSDEYTSRAVFCSIGLLSQSGIGLECWTIFSSKLECD